MNKKSSAIAIFVLFGPLSLLAQTTSTSILGTVADSSGAVITGARVTALHVRTGVKREEITTGDGGYNFPLLDVGEYEVTVESPGFKTETQKNIVLQINQKARVDFLLQVGAQTERIDITAEAAALKTDEASLGQVV